MGGVIVEQLLCSVRGCNRPGWEYYKGLNKHPENSLFLLASTPKPTFIVMPLYYSGGVRVLIVISRVWNRDEADGRGMQGSGQF